MHNYYIYNNQSVCIVRLLLVQYRSYVAMPSVRTSSSRKLRVFNTSSGTSHSKLYRTLLPSGVDKERRIEEKQCKELRRGVLQPFLVPTSPVRHSVHARLFLLSRL